MAAAFPRDILPAVLTTVLAPFPKSLIAFAALFWLLPDAFAARGPFFPALEERNAASQPLPGRSFSYAYDGIGNRDRVRNGSVCDF